MILMKKPLRFKIFISVFLFLLLVTGTAFFIFTGNALGQQTGFRRDPVIGGPLLEKPKTASAPKIILKRDTEGRYSWIVEGSDVFQVIREDLRLRHYLGRMEKKKKP